MKNKNKLKRLYNDAFHLWKLISLKKIVGVLSPPRSVSPEHNTLFDLNSIYTVTPIHSLPSYAAGFVNVSNIFFFKPNNNIKFNIKQSRVRGVDLGFREKFLSRKRCEMDRPEARSKPI